MQNSDEVREAVERFFERMSAGDFDGTAATIEDGDAASVIGTQRISDRAAWLESVRENIEAGLAFESGPIRAWAEGDVGWAVAEPAIVLPDGTRMQTRMTAVLRRGADGAFRSVHQHYSWAVPDEVGIVNAVLWREQLGLQTA